MAAVGVPPYRLRDLLSPLNCIDDFGLTIKRPFPSYHKTRNGWVCTFSMHGDNAHKSSGDASGHGWWVNDDCNATQAVVMVQLQQYINGSWVDAGLPAIPIMPPSTMNEFIA